MAMPTVPHHSLQVVPASAPPPAIVVPIKPDKVWMCLHLEQQQAVFRSIVTLCHGLLNRVVETPVTSEGNHE
jgi:hypothetical protein